MCLNTREKHVTMVMAINGLQCGGVLYLDCLVTLRHSVPLDTDITHVINEPGLPLHFCILHEIKNWTVGRPGMSLGVLFLYLNNKERKHVTMVMAINVLQGLLVVYQSYTQTQLRYIPLNHKAHGTAVLYHDSIN